MRLLPLLLTLILAPLASPQSATLPSRQSLSYSIEWRLITAGKAQLDWSALAGRRGGWEAKLHVESIGLVSKLFKVEDDYTATLNQALCTQSIGMVTHEGTRHRETRVTFDTDAKKATYLERDLSRNSTLLSKETELPGCVHDVVGGLFFLRTLNLEPGQATQIPVSDGKKATMARVEAQQREDIKTPAGTFKTIRYELFLFNGVLFQRSAHLYIWMTDDARKIPVQIRVRLQFTIGTITLLLDKLE
jgi:hypothetical protein